VLTVLAPTGEAKLALVGVSLRPPLADREPPDTIYLPIPDAPVYESFSVPSATGGMSMPVPFAASAAYHLDGRGHLWHGHGSEFRFFQSNLAGDTVRDVAVFDPEGRFQGRLQVEGTTRAPYVSPVVRGDRLHFVGASALDVPQVLVLEIDREGGVFPLRESL
jgi:hypothetical protein